MFHSSYFAPLNVIIYCFVVHNYVYPLYDVSPRKIYNLNTVPLAVDDTT